MTQTYPTDPFQAVFIPVSSRKPYCKRTKIVSKSSRTKARRSSADQIAPFFLMKSGQFGLHLKYERHPILQFDCDNNIYFCVTLAFKQLHA